MKDLPPRLQRERRTVRAMVALRCREGHAHRLGGGLCSGCQELMDYAEFRLDLCPFGSQKPTCTTCQIHCYRSPMRERMSEVMRESGPRMLWRHPIMALLHLLDGRRPAPARRDPPHDAQRTPTSR